MVSEGADRPQQASLAAYQAALLDVLDAAGEPDEMVDDIVAAAQDNGLELGALDPGLVSVASKLTRTWGQRRE